MHGNSDHGHVNVASLLLKAGADKGLAVLHGRTPLLCAEERGHVPIAVFLLEAGAGLGCGFELV
jgi:ankyrin repeat protein